MNKYYIKEEMQEKYIITNFFANKHKITNLQCTKPTSYATYDATLTSANTFCILEAKIRKGKYTFEVLKEEGVFIETKKFKRLIDTAALNNAIPLYLNYYPDGYITIHNLLNQNIIMNTVNVFITRSNSYEDRHILDIFESEVYRIDFSEELEANDRMFERLSDLYTDPLKHDIKIFLNQI